MFEKKTLRKVSGLEKDDSKELSELYRSPRGVSVVGKIVTTG
jgi:hypothetical protein